jgi:hypothetical protein
MNSKGNCTTFWTTASRMWKLPRAHLSPYPTTRLPSSWAVCAIRRFRSMASKAHFPPLVPKPSSQQKYPASFPSGASSIRSSCSPSFVSNNCECRLVPDQTPQNVDPLVIKYLEDEFAKLGSKNKMTIENLHGGKPWVADPKHWNYVAAAKATEVCRFQRLVLRPGSLIGIANTGRLS